MLNLNGKNHGLTKFVPALPHHFFMAQSGRTVACCLLVLLVLPLALAAAVKGINIGFVAPSSATRRIQSKLTAKVDQLVQAAPQIGINGIVETVREKKGDNL